MSAKSVGCVLVCLAIGAFAPAASASDIGQEIASQISQVGYQHYLGDLLYTHDGNNRGRTGPDHVPARNNIVATLESFGLTVELEPFTYGSGTYYNVIAAQLGTAYPDSYYLIGAHYDSADNPGADDNASGVAGVMEIARVLSQYPTEYTVKYAAFDLEEYGLLGSQAYVNAHLTDDIRGMISMDMIAYDDGAHSAEIYGLSSCVPIKNALFNALVGYGEGLTAELFTETSARSDHGPFQSAGYQACLLIEDNFDNNPCYHHACDSVDTANYINYAYAVKMTRSVAGYLADNAGAQWQFDCSSLAGCDPADHGGVDCNGNGVWDRCDVICGLSADVNTNGIPDECEPRETWYVDAVNCPGPGSGTLTDPFCKIQDAINAAGTSATGVVEIIVADGVYTGVGNKDLDFGGKFLYLRSTNGPANCIIDCEGSGRGFYFHTLETAAARVDGFTIRGASASGIYCQNGAPTFANCVITGNSAANGGGVYCAATEASTSCQPTLLNCTISGNTATSTGGGVYGVAAATSSSSNPTLINCTISGNSAGSHGGGIYTTATANSSSSSPTLINCTISGNTGSRGGGFYAGTPSSPYNPAYSNPALINCTISNNTARALGGGVFCTSVSSSSLSSPMLTNCTISGNTAPTGGGLHCAGSGTYLHATDCFINTNTATSDYGGGVYIEYARPTLANCTISGNTRGGVFCGNSSRPTLVNCTINGNTTDGSGGGVYCGSGSYPTLTDCVISGNAVSGTSAKGGGIYCNYSNPTLTNCLIQENTSSGSSQAYGGGVHCSYNSSPKLKNCVIRDNTATGPSASYGGGAYCESSSSITLTNCTISGNAAAGSLQAYGGGLGCSSSNPRLTNCILWGDTPQEVYVSSGTPNITYSDVMGGYTGTGNINADPGFVSAGDFHLTLGSPCIDTGTNSPADGLPGLDMDGNPRPVDGNGDEIAVADMGAYEFSAAMPVISVQPLQVEFALPAGLAGQTQTISIHNAGIGTLHWSLNWEASWLHAEPLTGESTSETDIVTLTADATTLARGTYSTLLYVTDPQALSPWRTVNVVLRVSGELHVPGEYATIQAAIDAATQPDDIVLVADGTYTGNGNKDLDFLGKRITVRSASGHAADCIIDCQGSGRGFYFHSGETAASIVDSLTIRNGNVTSSSPGGAHGGGVCCTSSSSPTLTRCIISGNTAGYGGGVYYSAGVSPTMTNCLIYGNTGRGVYCTSTSNLVLTNCTISANTGGSGGAIYHSASSVTLTNCILWGDSQPEIAGTTSDVLTVSYSVIQGGWSGTGNLAVYPEFSLSDDFHLASGSPCIDTGTNDPTGGLPAQDVDGNARPLDGNGDGLSVADIGVFEFNPAVPTLSVSPKKFELYGREGSPDSGMKAVLVRNAGGGTLAWTLEADASWVRFEPASGESTGEINVVMVSADAGDLTRGTYSAVLTFSDPQASCDPQTVEIVLYMGGKLRVPAVYATIQAAIDAVGLPGDEVSVADGVYTGVGNKDLDLGGKAICVRSANGNPATCIIDCQGSGRGFYFHSGESSDVVIEGFTIRNGLASYNSPGGAYGAGVFCSSSHPTLRNCVLTGGSAYSGGGFYGASCSSRLINCIIAGNTISGTFAHGGGICCTSSNLILTNCTIRGNSATGSSATGGGLYSSSSTTALTNCILWEDTPQEIHLPSGTLTVTYSDIQGGYAGVGNISVDPLFVDAVNGNLHVRANSPCIDVGSNAAVPIGITTDIDGDPRILHSGPLHIALPKPGQPLTPAPPPPVVDMGADEYRYVLPEPQEVPIEPASGVPGRSKATTNNNAAAPNNAAATTSLRR